MLFYCSTNWHFGMMGSGRLRSALGLSASPLLRDPAVLGGTLWRTFRPSWENVPCFCNIPMKENAWGAPGEAGTDASTQGM